MPSQIKLVGGSASLYLAEEIAQYQDIAITQTTIRHFSDGEIQLIIQESVRGQYVFFIQSTYAPADNLLELLLMMDAAKRASAKYITAVIPYFGYARQDRKDQPRVPIAAKLIANLLTTAGASRIVTMDLHAPQIQGFFDIPVDHLESRAIFIPYLRDQKLENLTFASPDVGSSKRARDYAKQFKAEMIICDKYREKANEIAGMTVIGDVKDRNVVLIDDIVDTAGTLCSAAQAIMDKGAKSVRAVCTHPVLSGKAYERIEESCLTEVAVCNTLPLKQTANGKIKELSVAHLFATAIKRVFEYRSISSLFARN